MSRLPWGHKSRHCVYCGKVGPRCVVAGGWAHKYCLPKQRKWTPFVGQPVPKPARSSDELNQIVDKVLAYRPKPKSKAAKKRKRRAAKHV